MLIIIHKYSWRVGHFRSRINYYPNSIYYIYTHPKVSPSYIHWSNNLPLARQQKASSFYIYFFRPQLFFPSIFFRYTIFYTTVQRIQYHFMLFAYNFVSLYYNSASMHRYRCFSRGKNLKTIFGLTSKLVHIFNRLEI